MDEDLELWKENSETLFNNVLVKFKHAKKHHLMKLRIQLKQDGEGSRLLRLQHGVSFCWKNSARLLSKKRTLTSEKNGAREDVYLREKWEHNRYIPRKKNEAQEDAYLKKKMEHKRMLTSEKNGAQKDAFLKEKWSIRGCLPQ
ncbi:hypothetical protein AT1G47495 [Arabidopsis thaliana]|uniref:Uncharacterized protein n=1 Tax=Arabidopsis thaliana TaxID=3702 RepID=F4HT92_ARATH|nr:uncharacterized protein AT1G47495 [Arabidopsis thaliana]AEE32175.1 hypothetical protein AT1G47495 [Arabidopsis thaliana]|eukprot:NP_683406.1 hypothetical protein AT1G47495 [Arabidopsis thaliana]